MLWVRQSKQFCTKPAVISNIRFPDRSSHFDVYWMQTNTQIDRQAKCIKIKIDR